MKCSPPLTPPTMAARAQRAGRLGFAFGPRFVVLLLAGLVWVGPAWWEPRFLLGMAVWDAFVLALFAADAWRLRRAADLEIRRAWKSPLRLATPGPVELEVYNFGATSVSVVLLDDAPVSLCPEPPRLEFHVPPGGSARAPYSIQPAERGDVRFGAVFLRYQSPLRLAEAWGRADVSQTVRIYPNLEEAKQHTIYLIRSRQIEMEKRLRRQRGRGREFESLREYRDGDEWRDVCWTATARRGKVITKSYQVERSQAVWLVLDAGRLLRARVPRLSKLDYAVNAALALAQVALYSGDRVGLLAYGRRPQQMINPGRGAGHLRAMIEGLALVRGEPSEAEHLRAAKMILGAQKWRSLVIWLTDLPETAATPDVIEIVSRMRPRHLLLFGVIGQPDLRQLTARKPEDVAQMYHYVAGLEVAHRRQVLLGKLRERGAMAMELEPKSLTPRLVNQYMEIKDRGLL